MGTYVKHDWAHGEVISEQLLDNIEEGISEAIGYGISKADKADTELDTTLSRGRKANTTVGTGSFAFGNNVTASGDYSHAEGLTTSASGSAAHAEGNITIASGNGSHAEGDGTIASGASSHAEGNSSEASGYISHAQGYFTIASHLAQHVFGEFNVSDPSQANSSSNGTYVEIVGNGTDVTERSNARALDWNGNEYLKGDLYIGCNSDSSGGTKVNIFEGAGSSAAGTPGLVPGPGAGDNIKFLRGDGTWQDISAAGGGVAEIIFNGAEYQPTNGTVTIDGGRAANTTIGTGSFAFGNNVTASGSYSHAEGSSTVASGNNSHVCGKYNVVDSYSNWPEWVANTAYTVGDKVKKTNDSTVIGYICNTDNNDSTFNSGHWSTDGHINYVEIIGNGTADNARSNARTLDWDGNERLKGTLYVNCTADSTGGHQVYDTSMIVYSDNPSGPANPVEGMIWLKPE